MTNQNHHNPERTRTPSSESAERLHNNAAAVLLLTNAIAYEAISNGWITLDQGYQASIDEASNRVEVSSTSASNNPITASAEAQQYAENIDFNAWAEDRAKELL